MSEQHNVTDLAEKETGATAFISQKDLLKELVNQVIEFRQEQSQIIRKYLEKKIRKGKYSFRFPFILEEKHIISFQDCIENRLKNKYGTNYELSFNCLVEFKNNDKLIYANTEELFNANHEESMLRIHLNWEYTVPEELNSVRVPVSYDVIIAYEIEQDSDHHEDFKIEEWGGILVEGSDTDWINETLKELKNLTNSTKMPFWWYYPKKISLALRDYIHFLFFSIAIVFISVLIIPVFYNSNETNEKFIERSRFILDSSEKLQAYIEYSLTPKPRSSIFVYFIAILGTGIVTILLSKASRHFFPPSMILIGCMKSKQKNKLIAYTFIWGAIVTSVIGLVIVAII